jgi:hypothetical protein
VYFYASVLYNDKRGNWSEEVQGVAHRRTRVLISMALRESQIVRRYLPDVASTSVYFVVGHARAKVMAKTRTDARTAYMRASRRAADELAQQALEADGAE